MPHCDLQGLPLEIRPDTVDGGQECVVLRLVSSSGRANPFLLQVSCDQERFLDECPLGALKASRCENRELVLSLTVPDVVRIKQQRHWR